MTPFDIAKIINEKKDYDLDEVIESYTPFIINRVYSNTIDSLFFANEMNGSTLDKDQQFAFYINILPKKKRYGEWHKVDRHAEVDLISEYYGINKQKAEQYLSVLTDEHVKTIKERMIKGGKS